MTITFSKPPLKYSIREQVLSDWLYELDEVNCLCYNLDDRGLYFTFYTYDYETMKHEQACYTPHYFTLAEVFSGSVELQALYEYLLHNHLYAGYLYRYEEGIRTYP